MILVGYRILVILGLFFVLCDITSVEGVKRCHECITRKSGDCENPIDRSKSSSADNLRESNVTLPEEWYCGKVYSEGNGQYEVEKDCRPKENDGRDRNKCADPTTNKNHGKPIVTFQCECDDKDLCNGGPPMAKISLASFILLGVGAYNI